MKPYKFKSLLYLIAFILSALLANSLEPSEDPSTSKPQIQVVEAAPTEAGQPVL